MSVVIREHLPVKTVYRRIRDAVSSSKYSVVIEIPASRVGVGSADRSGLSQLEQLLLDVLDLAEHRPKPLTHVLRGCVDKRGLLGGARSSRQLMNADLCV